MRTEQEIITEYEEFETAYLEEHPTVSISNILQIYGKKHGCKIIYASKDGVRKYKILQEDADA